MSCAAPRIASGEASRGGDTSGGVKMPVPRARVRVCPMYTVYVRVSGGRSGRCVVYTGRRAAQGAEGRSRRSGDVVSWYSVERVRSPGSGSTALACPCVSVQARSSTHWNVWNVSACVVCGESADRSERPCGRREEIITRSRLEVDTPRFISTLRHASDISDSNYQLQLTSTTNSQDAGSS